MFFNQAKRIRDLEDDAYRLKARVAQAEIAVARVETHGRFISRVRTFPFCEYAIADDGTVWRHDQYPYGPEPSAWVQEMQVTLPVKMKRDEFEKRYSHQPYYGEK